MDILKNVILHKTKKFYRKHPEWMKTIIISSLKKQSTLKDFIKIPPIIIKIY